MVLNLQTIALMQFGLLESVSGVRVGQGTAVEEGAGNVKARQRVIEENHRKHARLAEKQNLEGWKERIKKEAEADRRRRMADRKQEEADEFRREQTQLAAKLTKLAAQREGEQPLESQSPVKAKRKQQPQTTVVEELPTLPEEWSEKYQMKAFIGEGAEGKVFTAYDKSTCNRRENLPHPKDGRHSPNCWEVRVVKVLNHETDSEILFSKKLNEKEIPYVTKIRDHFHCPKQNKFFIVMDFGGRELVDLIKFGELSDADKNEILVQATTALQHLHHHNIVHLDIKASNMLWNSKSKQVTLIDWGFSRELNDPFLEKRRGFVDDLGTPAFRPPEQTDVKSIDWKKWDVYLLGLVMQKMFARKVSVSVDSQKLNDLNLVFNFSGKDDVTIKNFKKLESREKAYNLQSASLRKIITQENGVDTETTMRIPSNVLPIHQANARRKVVQDALDQADPNSHVTLVLDRYVPQDQIYSKKWMQDMVEDKHAAVIDVLVSMLEYQVTDRADMNSVVANLVHAAEARD